MTPALRACASVSGEQSAAELCRQHQIKPQLLPLRWIPTLYHASPEERAKYELNCGRTMIIGDPAKCAINDEIRITDYFGPAT